MDLHFSSTGISLSVHLQLNLKLRQGTSLDSVTGLNAQAEAIDKESNDGSDSKKQQPSAPPQDGDVLRMASWAVQCLKALTPTPRLGGEELAFEVGSLQVRPCSIELHFA